MSASNSKLLIGKPRRIRAATVSAYVFLAPMLAVMLCLISYPLLDGIYASFTDRAVAKSGTFVGFGNFVELFRDQLFTRAAWNSLVFTLSAVFVKLIMGLVAAVLLTQQFPLRNFVRALILLPWAVPGLIAGLSWRWIYAEDGGILNYILMSAGLVDSSVFWLSDAVAATYAIILAMVWHGLPFYIMMFMAGISAIPRDLYEAAAIDGAGPWKRFISVTLPQLHDVIMITVMLSTIWTFNSFHMVFILTGGGPGNKTHILPTLAYHYAIVRSSLGMGAAVMVSVIPIFVVIIVMLTRKMLRGND